MEEFTYPDWVYQAVDHSNTVAIRYWLYSDKRERMFQELFGRAAVCHYFDEPPSARWCNRSKLGWKNASNAEHA